MVSPREVRDVLEERPDLEPAVEAVLEPPEPWEFDDVDVDSGRFGELVARGLVEETDGGYRVSDRDAVERALAGDVDVGRDGANRSFDVDVSLSGLWRREFWFLLGALALVAGLRVVSFPLVFQDGHVVLSSNDPYYYRYWVEQLLTDPETTLSTLPAVVLKGEPLMVATLWVAARLVGGTPSAAGHVLAWYPVVSAVVTALLVYWLATVITRDRRIGLASVAMLAVLPGHAMRTSLGFADHHAFDYPWLVLTALGVVLVVTAAREQRVASWRRVAGATAVATGVSGQILAWEAGPLLIAPLGVYLAVEALRAVHADESPLSTTGPVVAGVGVAAALTWTVHKSLEWHTDLVASAPALLFVGGVAVLLAATIARRVSVPAGVFAVVELVGAAGGIVVYSSLRPDHWARLTTSITARLIARRNIAEVRSLFGDSVGWLLLFGFLFFLAVPYLVWGTWRARTDRAWLPPVVYGWSFLVLSAIQVRFVGELSPFAAVFAGLGFVHLAAWVDTARPPTPFADHRISDLQIPDGGHLRVLVLLFLLVTSLSIIQIPVKTSQITVPQEQYETAAWMADYSDQHDLEYPQNYVFSEWGENRMYNYFVNGHARSYGYARTNFVPFVTSTAPTRWYERLRDRTGFVVTTPAVVTNASSIGTRLHENYGSRNASVPGLSHYRAVYASDSGRYKAFVLVPGAVIAGNATANETVTLSTTVDVPGATFTYERRVVANETGRFRVRIAYPGTYRVNGQTVTVPERAVRNGTTVPVAAA